LDQCDSGLVERQAIAGQGQAAGAENQACTGSGLQSPGSACDFRRAVPEGGSLHLRSPMCRHVPVLGG
jgi:hypothetical protein